ncbi:unnamed protein product [Brugia pahangi]|uniref:Uncharacterized protein n=1 Tax=Brugia pahangi TaxID=6280 RepID=A0A0N4SYC9_BRUPA|nr:unnamed protein product [Brugia pahangi]
MRSSENTETLMHNDIFNGIKLFYMAAEKLSTLCEWKSSLLFLKQTTANINESVALSNDYRLFNRHTNMHLETGYFAASPRTDPHRHPARPRYFRQMFREM